VSFIPPLINITNQPPPPSYYSTHEIIRVPHGFYIPFTFQNRIESKKKEIEAKSVPCLYNMDDVCTLAFSQFSRMMRIIGMMIWDAFIESNYYIDPFSLHDWSLI
jgi:hypothetical protein